MSGFGFGAGNTSTNPAATGSSFLFGANTTTVPTTGFGLGSTATGTGSLFGGTTAQPSFGAPATSTPGLSFGSSAPQTSSGLSFGGQSTFGAPASTTSTGLFGPSTFGAPAQSTGLSFGQPTSQPLTFGAMPGFGAPASQPGTLSFGGLAASTAAATPLSTSFGAPTTQPTGLGFGQSTSTGLGLGFGAPNVTAPSSGLSFGAPAASTAATGFGFGSASVSTQPATLGLGTSGGLSFGAATTTTPGLSFGSTATSTGTLTGFQGLSGATSTAAKPLSLSFGATPASTAGSGLGLSLAPTSTQPTTGFGAATSVGLFGSLSTSKPLTLGLAPTSAAPSLGFGAPVSATPSLGLGGIDTSASKTGQAGSGTGRTDTKAVKENLIPNEIMQTIDGFKCFVKSQKSVSSDVARGSTKSLNKVREDTEALTKLLAKITAGLQKNRSLADHLKCQTATALRNAEMAQRTHDTPPGLQYDNIAPLQYFTELVAAFEHEMQSFRLEIEKTEKHIKSLTEPRPLAPQELNLAMKRLHDSFVALAGRLQTVHNSVEMQKDQYSNLRKYFLKDTTNVFEESAKKPTFGGMGRPLMPNRITLGPTPFSGMGNQLGYGLLPAGISETTPTFPTGNPLGWSGIQSQQPSSLGSSFAATADLGLGTLSRTPNSSLDSQGFMLQKPPPGTKRNKR